MSRDASSEQALPRAWVRPPARPVPRHDLSRAQRARLVSAAELLICDGGAERVTVAEVCAAARVPSRVFHAAFEDCDACLLAVFDDASERAAAAIARAYRAGGSWVERVRCALFELLTIFDKRPGLARFLLIDTLAGDQSLRARRVEALAALACAIELDCPRSSAASLPPFGADALVGTIASILHARLRVEPPPSLREMCGALMALIVLPYLDAEAARRELMRPVFLSAA
jgi:AcrR family transcriptional regulator